MTYDLLLLDAIETVVRLAHDKGALVYVDGAGGARVGPAAFGQPRMLELGVDIGATGLGKYGTKGPRFGLLAGRRSGEPDPSKRFRVRHGSPATALSGHGAYAGAIRSVAGAGAIATTKQVAGELRLLLGNRVRETPTTVQIAADDILEIAMERGGLQKARVVSYEASAALSSAK